VSLLWIVLAHYTTARADSRRGRRRGGELRGQGAV